MQGALKIVSGLENTDDNGGGSHNGKTVWNALHSFGYFMAIIFATYRTTPITTMYHYIIIIKPVNV